MTEKVFSLPSAAETARFGAALAACLGGGDAVLLFGEPGAGKTVIVQGAGRALKVKEQITSPTFTLVQEYAAVAAGRAVQLTHIDLYRLRRPEEAEVIGAAAFLRPDAVVFVEWPEFLVAAAGAEALRLELTGDGMEPRRAVLSYEEEYWGAKLGPLLNEYIDH
ncbi:MAG: tRNA (adenosine(37)-N6)-threonylcarbamoyltransferase complex ATPase subunit type 1 TsaE [Gracilibacteraceae bacterium]|jgi:tRNA threonylcarbamoyladenosine biosynthesis protein TsaE|nr:tRNA (adenosine(37)-N6)-threonylcarbamoyltransferase complex ATPase subunit type 1 TsaE [Gracilibacteraceae bacterium]